MSRLTKTILYAFYFIAVIALGVVIVMSFTDKHSTKQPKTLASKPSTSQSSSSSTGAASTGNSQSGKTSTASPSHQSSTASSAASPSQSSKTLTNTGPGNYVALFVGAAVIGGYIYHRRLVNRIAQLDN